MTLQPQTPGWVAIHPTPARGATWHGVVAWWDGGHQWTRRASCDHRHRSIAAATACGRREAARGRKEEPA